jgi:hypothetical protein
MAGNPEPASICSTMLLPNSANARCATVSPTERAMAAFTADCICGSLPATALEFCRILVSNSRSRGLRIRSSCIKVSEKASRICFAVIGHTPPSRGWDRLSSVWAKWGSTSGGDIITKAADYQLKIWIASSAFACHPEQAFFAQ